MAVWPDQLEAWNVFAACSTQWRVITAGDVMIHQGLEYASLESVMRIRSVADPAACLAQIQHIERGAVAAMNE